MTEKALRRQMADLGRSLFDRGYATGGAGNMSAKLPDGAILMTPTNSSFGRLDPDALSLIDAEGKHLSGDKPTKEDFMHLSIYRVRKDCGAVVHLHSTHLTALSCLKELDPKNALRAFTPYYVMRVGRLPVIPYYKPGDPRIAEDAAALAPSCSAMLLANHGPIVLGSNLIEAVNNSEELEETAKLYFLLGDREINYLSDEAVAELAKGRK